mgnify:CR=1 FL=1
MIKLSVYIEIKGKQRLVGYITGDSYIDSCFQYSESFLNFENSIPISISLPLQKDAFSADATRIFFEGLLPEGFSRKAVANWIKTDENDYITILSVLGHECIGAIKIVGDEKNDDIASYEKLDIEQVKELAKEGASKSTQILMETHLSLTGASGKVGLYYDSINKDWYLPKGDAPSTHIIKQSHIRLNDIVINEQLCMLTAKNLNLEVPESFIINTETNMDELLYATKRYDRAFTQNKSINNLIVPNRLHQEDFAQAMGIASKDKYEKKNEGYLKRIFDLIRINCSNPIADQNKLWQMICFNYLIGNTDCHIKNLSLLYDDNLRNVRLAPFYDIVGTRVYGLTKDMSFFIGGEIDIDKINRENFIIAAKDIGFTEKNAMNIFDTLANSFENALNNAANELIDSGFKSAGELKEKILLTGGYSNI